MWANGIVMPPPTLDDDLRLPERVENLPVQQLVSEAGVEALDVSVLPRTARRDIGRLGADRADPLPQGFGDELGPIVRTNVPRHAAQDEEVGQHVDHINRLQPPGHADRQALVRELVDHVEHPVLPSIVRAIFDEVVRPHVIAMLRPEPEARAISQPKPAALGLFGGNLQPLSPPDPLDALVVDDPASRRPQQLRDLAIAVAAVLPGQFDDIGREPFLVISTLRCLALRRAMLTERRAGTTLGYLECAPNVLDNGTPARGA